jgi:hypothetical protein
MACNLNITLADHIQNDTWDGLTVSASSTGTAFDGTLALVRMQFQDSAGAAVLTLSSATSGQITISSSTPNAWSFTVEGRALTILPAIYSWGIEMVDDAGIVKTRLAGTKKIKPDPVQ